MTDIGAWLISARDRISISSNNNKYRNDPPDLICQVILANVLDQSRTWIMTHSNCPLDKNLVEKADCYISEYIKGVPLPYILGYQEFYGLKFHVTPDVLIPRPETEHLVDEAILFLKNHPDRRWAVDVGTGSGCIAVSLCSQIHDLQVVATDISMQALRLARFNRDTHHLTNRIHLVQADLLSGFSSKLNIICANLPYIPTSSLGSLPVSAYEPKIALDGGDNGLIYIDQIISSISKQQFQSCLVLLEIQNDQASVIYHIAQSRLKDYALSTIKDYSGHDRIIRMELAG